MKRILALILVLIMAVSMVACGNNDTNKDNEGTSGQSEIQSDQTPTTDNSDETANDGPAFDTSWAANDFEALLPELPFTGWTTSQPDANTYKMEKTGLNTSPATNPPDSGEADGADKTKLKDYLNTLTAYGFTVEETGTGYQWGVKDATGNEAEFMVGDGGCFITIKKAN